MGTWHIKQVTAAITCFVSSKHSLCYVMPPCTAHAQAGFACSRDRAKVAGKTCNKGITPEAHKIIVSLLVNKKQFTVLGTFPRPRKPASN